ncbi:tetratricopeptide repeat protein, partial [Candidatus Riflebacteria bacterium]
QKQLNKDPQNLRAKFVLALSSFLLDDYVRADELFEEILIEDSTYPDVELYSNKVKLKLWFPLLIPLVIIIILANFAYILWKKLPEMNRKSTLNLAKKRIRSGFFTEGLELYKKVNSNLLNDYQRMNMYVDMALAFRKTGDFNSGIVKAKEALRMDPQNPEAREILAWCYLGMGTTNPETVPSLMELYKKEKNNISLVELLAKFHMKAKNTKKDAMEIYDRLLLLDPSNMDIQRYLAQHFLKTRKMDKKALKIFQNLAESDPEDIDVQLGMARIYLSEDKIDDCIALCDNILSLDINNAGVHLIYRDAYKKAERLDELMASYEKLLEEHPHIVTIQNAYTECRKLTGTAETKRGSLAARLGADFGDEDAVADVDNPFSTPSPLQNQDQASVSEGNQGNSVECQHCRYMNKEEDYYCQGCGQPLS